MGNPLGDLISEGEGGYNSYNRGTYRADDGRTRILAANQEIDFSQMSIVELQRRQDLPITDPDRVFAVGKYQIIPSTMDEVIRKLGIEANEKYTPELQERMFADSLIRLKRPDIYKYIIGEEGATLRDAQKAASLEWASVEDPDTPGHANWRYERQGNRMHTTAARVGEALDAMRNDYKTSIDRGSSPEDAWRSVTGAAPPPPSRGPLDDLREAVPRIMDGSATFGPRMTDGGLPEYLLSSHARAKLPFADGVLREGERGVKVGALQMALNAHSAKEGRAPSLVVDNVYGPATRREVEAFQLWNGLPTTGIADRETLSAVLHAQAPSPDNPADAADLRNPNQGYGSPFVAPTPSAPSRESVTEEDFGRLGWSAPSGTPPAASSDVVPPMTRSIESHESRDSRSPTDPAHPDHADYMKVHDAVTKDGRWTDEQTTNISAALLKEYKADLLSQRLDSVKVGNMLPNGDVNIFASYEPWGPGKGGFHSWVGAAEAAQQPAQRSFEEAQHVTQQNALAQQENTRALDDPNRGGPKMAM